MINVKHNKNGVPFCCDDEAPHFPFKSTWKDFVSTLDMNDENIKILIEEVEFYRKKAGEYYQYYLDANL